jgi:peptidoglycan/LPS O-acetylase OafA/YrhL
MKAGGERGSLPVSPAELLHRALAQKVIPSLDGLRAIAVSVVMIYHAGHEWMPGGQGVTLFFVVSGFLITWLLLREEVGTGTVSLRNFYVRRSLRIFPAFYAYWSMILCLLLFTGRDMRWGHIWSSFFYAGNYWIAADLPENASLSHTWSLAIEEQFYLLFPGFFLLMKADRKRLGAVLVIVVGMVWVNRILRVMAGDSMTYLNHATDTRMDHLLIGCIVAIAVSQGVPAWFDRFLTKPAYVATIAALVLSLTASEYSPLVYRMTVGFSLEPVLLGIILLQSIMLQPALLQARPVVYIGRISYGMYLYQQVAIPTGQKLMPGSNDLLDLFAGVILTIGMAELSFRLVEQRFLRLKKHWSVQQVEATPAKA